MNAVICPVCNGKGQFNSDSIGTGVNLKTCHGCGGKGWVAVSEDIPYFAGGIPQPFIDPNKCPACGGDRNSLAGTRCPIGSHYRTYSEGK